MTRKIFKGIFLVSCITLLASIILIMGVLYEYFSNRFLDELKSEAGYIANAVELSGYGYFDGLKTSSNTRLTWIDTDGTVLFDTSADASEMENHSDREEFIEARESGTGEAVRYSETLSKRTVYFAEELTDGSVLRISGTQYTVWMLLFSVLLFIIFVIVIALVLSAVLAKVTAKLILKPVNEIDLNNPDIDEKYEEFAPLLSRINRQNAMIDKQMSELSQKQDEFRMITENMSEGLLMVDGKTDILFCNASALKLLGASMPAATTSVFTINRSEAFRSAVEDALSGKHSVKELASGGRYCQIMASPVYQNGQSHGAVIMIVDITEKEQLEKMRREFTSNVSHELKTPLTSISGMSELLMSGDMPREDAADFAKSIHDESARLISLVNDIIKLSQLDEGAVPVPKTEVDLYDTAQKVMELLYPAARKKNISFEILGEHLKVRGVPAIIEEMIYNLCDNAVKYNKDGGSVQISLVNEDGRPSITVADTGIGIPKEHLGRVTERFYRVDKSHSKKIGGTGLGLSIVKHGAAFHNAEMSINSIEGNGTAVKIKF